MGNNSIHIPSRVIRGTWLFHGPVDLLVFVWVVQTWFIYKAWWTCLRLLRWGHVIPWKTLSLLYDEPPWKLFINSKL